MNLKNKTTLLAAAIALAGVSYLPSASASIDTYTNDDQGYYKNTSLSTGVAADWYDFKVTGDFTFIATENSSNTTGKRTELLGFDLFKVDHTSHIATGSISSPAPGKYSGYVVESGLLTAGDYSLRTIENTFSPVGSYSLSLTTSPVPLPGAVWMMLTGMIGLFGYQARNKKTA